MRCPYCKSVDSRVLESRAVDDELAVRRRRECPACGRRFTTFERPEVSTLYVIKKDGNREEFDRDKLRRGVTRACEKRPVSADAVTALVEGVERDVREEYEREVSSREIGERVMGRLRALDGVAYVRFASVYREFRDVRTFAQEVLQLLHQEDADVDAGERDRSGR
ncbi:MAG: transcriptional regulator NrdR [Firmicutes bacterium]|nr:transcriptional regulator NrdR [Bacillota bacterium]